MKVNELRLGNLIEYYVGEDGIEWLLNITEGWVISDFENNPDEFEKSNRPILITEEWVLKLGFQHSKTDKSNVYKSGIFMFVYPFDGRFKGKRMVTLANVLTLDENNIKYVHQLQNLYFALTGEELKTQEHE